MTVPQSRGPVSATGRCTHRPSARCRRGQRGTRWTYRTDAGAVPTPTVVEDTVYLCQGEELAAVARVDGTKRWHLGVGARTGSMVVVGDTLYAHTNPGHGWNSTLLAIREP